MPKQKKKKKVTAQQLGKKKYNKRTITPNDSDSDADRNVVDSRILKCFHRGTCRVIRSRQIMDEPATTCTQRALSVIGCTCFARERERKGEESEKREEMERM